MTEFAGKTVPSDATAHTVGVGVTAPYGPASASPADDPRIGAVLKDCYRIERRLGAGGMGAVYLAEHTALKKRVAIKILSSEFTGRTELKERFLREARAAAAITDDHVIEIHDFGETPDGAAFFVMEYLQGEDLADLLAREGPLPWPRARDIALQICGALQAAHARGIVHRDMKPANCFRLDRPGRDVIKVLDFGIAKIQSPDEGVGQALTRTGMIFGTPEYMSPEQAQGAHHDHRVDIYATGVILFELLTGQTPFAADTFMGLLNKHMFEPPPRPGDVAPQADIPAPAEAVVLKALQKDPDLRFQSMADMAAALSAADAGVAPELVAEPLRAPPKRGEATTFRAEERAATTPPAAPSTRRRGWALVVVAALAGAAAVTFLIGQGPKTLADPPGPIEPPSPTPAPAPAPVLAPQPPAPPPTATVTIRIDTGGVAAQVLDEDGAVLGGTADAGGLNLPRGTDERLLRLRADGFDDTLVKVVPSADRNLTAALTRKPEPTKAAKPAKSPARPDKKAGPEPPPPTTNPDPKPTSPDLIRPF